MAEQIKQKFVFNSFIGGEGDGFYQGPANSYRSGANLETRKLENGVMVCNKLTVDHTYTGTIKGVSDYYDRLYCSLSGSTSKIYYAGTFKFDMGIGTVAHDTILGWGRMKRTAGTETRGYGISATNTTAKIHRFDADFSGATYSVASFTPNTPLSTSKGKIPTLSVPRGIIFGYGNTIYTLDLDELVTESLVLQFSADIVGITVYQNIYRIYYNDGNHSYISSWDGISNIVEQTVEYKNSPINGVISDGPYDYGIFGDGLTTDLYRVAGLERQQVRNNIEISDGNSRTLLSEIGIAEGIIYISGQNKNVNECLYSFGSYIPGTANSLVPENLTSGTIQRFSFAPQKIYIYISGNVYKRTVAFKGECDTSIGSITHFPIIGNIGIDTEKELERIYVMHKLNNTSDTIKIYARITGGPFIANNTGYTLLKTITGSTTTRRAKITKDEIITAGFRTFEQIEFRVDIQNAGTSSAIYFGMRGFYLDNPGD